MRKRKIFTYSVLTIVVLGFLAPEEIQMPVKGADSNDYNSESFWYYPWGQSVTHKGVDIFADTGTEIQSPTTGIVLFKGELHLGGNVVIVLGPKWRLHYLAHLNSIDCSSFDLVSGREVVGTVGDSGNAKGKPPHLHYSIITIIPYPWRIDSDRQGWKKMFYLNPIDKLD